MKKGISLLIAATLLLSGKTVVADELMFTGITWHGSKQFEDTDGQLRTYNGVNPGAIYTFDNGIGVGTFKNSYFKTSVMINYRFLWNDNLGVMGGYATGYEERNSKGIIGGFLLRTNPSSQGWRLVTILQPFGGKSSAFSLAISKEL